MTPLYPHAKAACLQHPLRRSRCLPGYSWVPPQMQAQFSAQQAALGNMLPLQGGGLVQASRTSPPSLLLRSSTIGLADAAESETSKESHTGRNSTVGYSSVQEVALLYPTSSPAAVQLRVPGLALAPPAGAYNRPGRLGRCGTLSQQIWVE